MRHILCSSQCSRKTTRPSGRAIINTNYALFAHLKNSPCLYEIWKNSVDISISRLFLYSEMQHAGHCVSCKVLEKWKLFRMDLIWHRLANEGRPRVFCTKAYEIVVEHIKTINTTLFTIIQQNPYKVRGNEMNLPPSPRPTSSSRRWMSFAEFSATFVYGICWFEPFSICIGEIIQISRELHVPLDLHICCI